jgi:hypothetical protein
MAAPPRRGARLVRRNWGIVAYFAAFSGFVDALLLGGVFASKPVLGKVAAALGCVIVTAAITQILRAGIVCDDEGVTVRGLVGARRASWSQLADFITPATRSISRGAFIGVQLHDGSRLVTQGLTTPRRRVISRSEPSPNCGPVGLRRIRMARPSRDLQRGGQPTCQRRGRVRRAGGTPCCTTSTTVNCRLGACSTGSAHQSVPVGNSSRIAWIAGTVSLVAFS